MPKNSFNIQSKKQFNNILINNNMYLFTLTI